MECIGFTVVGQRGAFFVTLLYPIERLAVVLIVHLLDAYLISLLLDSYHALW